MKINLPSVIFNHIEINKENFITKLEVADTLDTEGVGTWFNNDNIKDMLELVVIKAETEEMRDLTFLCNICSNHRRPKFVIGNNQQSLHIICEKTELTPHTNNITETKILE